MYEDHLEHLLTRKEEIDEVSPWPRVKLRVIKEDLAPLIQKGVPINHLIKILEPLAITSRKDTLRRFIIEEFPEAYARYYAKQKKAQKIKEELGINRRVIEEHRPSTDETDINEEPVSSIEEAPAESEGQRPRKAQQLDPNEISEAFSDFNRRRK